MNVQGKERFKNFPEGHKTWAILYSIIRKAYHSIGYSCQIVKSKRKEWCLSLPFGPACYEQQSDLQQCVNSQLQTHGEKTWRQKVTYHVCVLSASARWKPSHPSTSWEESVLYRLKQTLPRMPSCTGKEMAWVML